MQEERISEDDFGSNSMLLEEAELLAQLGSWTFHAEENQMNWSKGFFRILGLSYDLKPRSIEEYVKCIPKEDQKTITKAIETLIKTGKDFQLELDHQRSNGEIRHCIVKGKLKQKVKGHTLLYGTIQDLTERIEFENSLEEARNKAVEMAGLKQKFFTNISHEIRTPMNAILGFTELLEESDLKEEHAKYVRYIQTSAQNLLIIINDLLDFSKIESGKFSLQPDTFNPHELFDNINNTFINTCQKKNLNWVVEVDPSIPSSLYSDAVRLNQILVNLIGNAIKFTPEGSVEVYVRRSKETEDKIWLDIEVMDSGKGIPSSQIDKIFDSFHQVQSKKRKSQGTGLGLSIVKALVDLLEGQITLTSSVGKGTSFYLKIPFLKSVKTGRLSNQINSTGQVLSGVSVLVAEDQEMNQKLIQKVLEKRGAKVCLEDNGKKALQKCHTEEFDIILMDVQMPVMDGLESTKEIRKFNENIPIIGLTAHAIPEEQKKCIAAGMNAVITKPFETKKLIQTIKNLTENTDLSLQQLNELAGNDQQFVEEMIQDFLTQSESLIHELNSPTKNNDKVAHKLKSMVALFGSVKLVKLLEKIETQPEKSRNLLKDINKEYNDLLIFLKQKDTKQTVDQ